MLRFGRKCLCLSDLSFRAFEKNKVFNEITGEEEFMHQLLSTARLDDDIQHILSFSEPTLRRERHKWHSPGCVPIHRPIVKGTSRSDHRMQTHREHRAVCGRGWARLGHAVDFKTHCGSRSAPKCRRNRNSSFLWLFPGMPRRYRERVSEQTAQTRNMVSHSGSVSRTLRSRIIH